MRILKSKTFIGLAVVLFILFGCIFYFFYGTPWDMISYKNKFETYLENKYEKDFVIKEISFDFLHGRTYHAYAFSEDNPEVTFHVGQNSKLDEFEDAYHYEIWNYQARSELTPIIEEIFSKKFNHAIEVGDFLSPNHTKSSHVPNYKDMVTLEIGIAMDNTTITEENKEEEMKKVFNLLEVLNEKGVNIGHLGISYKSKTLQLSPSEMNSVTMYGDLKKWLHDYK